MLILVKSNQPHSTDSIETAHTLLNGCIWMKEKKLENISNHTSPQWILKGTLCFPIYYDFVDAFHVDAGLMPIRLTTNFSSDDMWFEGP